MDTDAISNLGRVFLFSLVLFPALTGACAANAEEVPKFRAILAQLSDSMYATGETSPTPANFDAKIAQARSKIKDLAASDGESALVEKDKFGMTPLIMASYYGYSGVVEELLGHEIVRKSINEIDGKEISAWDYSNFALQEAPWVCNPSVLKDPFRAVPVMVQQPYYSSGAEPPYVKVRALLEKTGAAHDMSQVKRKYASVCKSQTPEEQQKTAAAADLQAYVRREGQEVLVAALRDAAAHKNQK